MNKKFETGIAEKIISFLIIPAAWIYTCFITGEDNLKILFTVFTLLFISFGEALNFRKKRSAESFIYFGCILVLLFALLFGKNSVWQTSHIYLFLHLFSVYWIMVRGNCLSEEKTSHMFVWDGITGFFVLPFKRFILQSMTIVSCFTGRKQDGTKKSPAKAFLTIGAILAGIGLLIAAICALQSADENFADLVGRIFSPFKISWGFDVIWRVWMTVHVSFYLYGLLGGSCRETRAHFEGRAGGIKRFLVRIQKVPSLVWILFTFAFTAAYLIFFILQGSYLFGAFGDILQKGYTYASYARRGLGDMCVVMLINFAVIWLTSRTSEKKSTVLIISETALIAESMIFALIAAAKIFMYIRAFGFTPLRLQSVWLVAVLFLGCICMLISLLSKKKTAFVWFTSSAVSLALLALV